MSDASEWIATPLGKHCAIKTGKKDVNEGNPEGFYPFFTCSREHTYSDSFSFDTEAILIAGNGDVGNLHYYNGRFEAYQRTYVLDSFDIDIFYVYHYLSSLLLKSLEKEKIGTSIPYIKLGHLSEFEIKIPKAVEQQQKIAHILTTVDNLIEKTQALIDKYTAVKQGMMHDLFTRGIDLATGQLRPSYEQAPELYKETELGWVPREWGVLELKNVLDFLDGQRIPLKSEDRYFMQGPYPYYGASGIIDYVNSYIFDGDYILLGEDGENVVSRNVPLAFRVSGKIWVNNHAHVLKPKNGHSLDFYVEYLESLNYENIVSGSAQPKITQSQLARLFVISPDLHEQVKISEVISALEAKKQREVDSLGKLREQKKGLMQDLLTGRVRVDG